MRLSRLELQEFRSYRHSALDIPATGLRLYGPNASGKTTLLEAIYLLATTRSSRASLERDMINWESNQDLGLEPFARVIGQVVDGNARYEIEVALTGDPTRPNGSKKRLKVDGRPRRAVDAVGTLKVVLFSPEDLDLVLGSPSGRRRYLDITLSQLDRSYLQALSAFSRIVEQRNSLLKSLAGRGARRDIDEQLAYWDTELTRNAAHLLASRLHYMAGLQDRMRAAFTSLAGEGLAIQLDYLASIDITPTQRERLLLMSIRDSQQLLGRAIEESLHRRREEELRRGVTVVGPHRDDFRFTVDGRDLSSFGSRGQQRLAVVATKLGELAQLVEITGTQPVLMLDDVLSELDPRHQSRLLATLGDAGCQVIITGTDRDLIDQPALKDLPIARVTAGIIEWVGLD